MIADLDFVTRTEGVSRDILESRIRALASELREARREAAQTLDALTSVQTVSTRQCEELRRHRRLSTVADTPEGRFLTEALHELALARIKYPGPEGLETLIMVLAEETGEVARAHLHKEGPARIREESAQVVATAVRLVVEGLAHVQSDETPVRRDNV